MSVEEHHTHELEQDDGSPPFHGRHALIAPMTPAGRGDVMHLDHGGDDRVRLASYRRSAARPPAAQAGAWVVLIVGLAVLMAQWWLYPESLGGQSDANWALGFMILSSAGAVRILFGNPGPHAISAVVIILCGVGLLLRALLVGDGLTGLDGFEITCGALWLLGGVAALASPMLTVEQPPPTSWG